MRAELAGLSGEQLARLYNPGLVKRAEREIASGQGPALEVLSDETIEGRFPDGTLVRIPASTPLDRASCSCGSTAMCRHRIAVVLVYGQGQSSAPPAPLRFEEEALIAALGRPLLAAARRLVESGVVVRVDQRADHGEATAPASGFNPASTAIVHLPTCTVYFPNASLDAARCDCAQVGRCEHLALAAWALAQAKDSAPFELAGRQLLAAPPSAVLSEFLALAGGILDRGAAHAEGYFAERFARARVAAQSAGMVWIAALLEDLERLLEGYRARSARYDEAKLLSLLVELYARARSAGGGSELPTSVVLGTGEAAETLLERVRLVSLGARIEADGRQRRAEVYLADPATGTVGVLRQSWTFEAGQALPSGPELGQRTVAPRIDLATLARGNIVSQAVRRRANLELLLGTRPGQTSLLPGGADFERLPSTLCVRDYAALEQRLAAQPPWCLRPRVLAESMTVLAIAEIERVRYDARSQTCAAEIVDAEGHSALVRLEHRAISPHGLDAFAAAFSRGARFVSGHVQRLQGVLVIDATSAELPGQGLVVFDLAEKPGSGAGDQAESGSLALPASALSPVLESVAHVLAEIAHHGLARLPRDLLPRLRGVASEVEEAGLSELAGLLRGLAAAPSAPAWAGAALWWVLAVSV